MPATPENDQLIAELEAGMSEDSSDPEATFTAQLEAWFQLEYGKESIRVQYQRMVAMGKRTENDPNLKPVIERFGNAKLELEIVELLMKDLLDGQDGPESVTKMLNTAYYYPTRGVTFSVPDGLKKRLIEMLAT